MAQLNRKTSRIKNYTHEGAPAKNINAEQQLRRTVCACMLWEDTFYEDGQSIADRICQVLPQVDPQKVYKLAIEARENMKLRHVPLLIAREMAKHDSHRYLVRHTLSQIIQRPDELTEFLSIYWKDKRQPLSAQVKKGLADAFPKFSEYQLAKYNRDNDVKLRDVLFLSHAKPRDEKQAKVWKQLIDGTLQPPDTWEVNLSKGKGKKSTKDKKTVWENMLSEKKMGGLALLRNLRNMKEAGVNEKLIFGNLKTMKTDRILPFRFISAAKYAPQWESEIEEVMLKSLENRPKLPGKTALLIDGSGSMFWGSISGRSELTNFDAANALAILAREMCETCSVTVFSNSASSIPNRRGFALRDAIAIQAEKQGTFTQGGIDLAAKGGYDRIIIFTDEQSHQRISNPIKGSKGYVINISTNEHGVGYGEWNHIDGFSESVLDYIREFETL